MEDWLTEQAPGGQKKSKVPGYFHPCKLFSTPLNKEQRSKEQLLQPVFLGKHLKKIPSLKLLLRMPWFSLGLYAPEATHL